MVTVGICFVPRRGIAVAASPAMSGSPAGRVGGSISSLVLCAEVWQFKTPELNLDNFASEFRFAVFYRVQATGEVFWDNNFGQDYRNSKADGATVG